MSGLRQMRVLNGLNEFSVEPGHGDGCCDNALLAEADRPSEFRGNGLARMIAFPVHTQRKSPAIRRIDPVGGIFREIDHAGGTARRQRVVRDRAVRQFKENRQLQAMRK